MIYAFLINLTLYPNLPSRNIFFLSLLSREGDGTPFQYFCLENPMDGGAWWAAVYGVTKS